MNYGNNLFKFIKIKGLIMNDSIEIFVMNTCSNMMQGDFTPK
jgi:hypothetical protein